MTAQDNFEEMMKEADQLVVSPKIQDRLIAATHNKRTDDWSSRISAFGLKIVPNFWMSEDQIAVMAGGKLLAVIKVEAT